MKVEDNRTLRAPRHANASCGDVQADFSRWVIGSLPGTDDKYIALAPGRLDVLGGIAEYTGGLVLAAPLAEHACVGVQQRSDGLISIVLQQAADRNGAPAFEIPFSRLRAAEGGWVTAVQARECLKPHGDSIICVVGTLIEALRTGALRTLPGGVSVAVASDLEGLPGGSFTSAVSSAALVSAAALAQEIIEPNVAALISQTVENDWLGLANGPSGALCGLLGEAHSLMQLRCDNRTLGGAIRLPEGVDLLAIDCGAIEPGHSQKFLQVRTATFMGRLLIDRIIQHDRLLSGQWDGHLSRVSVNDFVVQLRDRLPTRMLGREFLNRFGETGDPMTSIDPDHTYKIRSRTEHHVYEHDRSRQFVEAVSRAIRTGERSALVIAGGVMNASHWSCGQRCGLGSAAANSLVNDLRKAGPAAGIFGARIAGRGCGSMVAVLADTSEAAQQAIQGSLAGARRGYNVPARILTGSLAGAMVSGAVRV